jgi:hypothetical protein
MDEAGPADHRRPQSPLIGESKNTPRLPHLLVARLQRLFMINRCAISRAAEIVRVGDDVRLVSTPFGGREQCRTIVGRLLARSVGATNDRTSRHATKRGTPQWRRRCHREQRTTNKQGGSNERISSSSSGPRVFGKRGRSLSLTYASERLFCQAWVGPREIGRSGEPVDRNSRWRRVGIGDGGLGGASCPLV